MSGALFPELLLFMLFPGPFPLIWFASIPIRLATRSIPISDFLRSLLSILIDCFSLSMTRSEFSLGRIFFYFSRKGKLSTSCTTTKTTNTSCFLFDRLNQTLHPLLFFWFRVGCIVCLWKSIGELVEGLSRFYRSKKLRFLTGFTERTIPYLFNYHWHFENFV